MMLSNFTGRTAALHGFGYRQKYMNKKITLKELLKILPIS